MSLTGNTSILLKAPPGFGKTLAAASFALEGEVYMAYFDKKEPVELLHYFSRFGDVGKKILDNIEYDVFSSPNAGEYLEKLLKIQKNCRYFAIITDSVTSLTSASVNWSMAFRKSGKKKDDDQKVGNIKVIPDWDEYKVETSLVTQALDICKSLPCHVIWTAHPLPGIKVEGSGSSIRVTKTNPIVSYGSKVAGIIPGEFSEIYHFSKQNAWDQTTGASSTQYIVSTESIGDDFAKSNLGLKGDIDITNKLFFPVWKEKLNQLKEEINAQLTPQTEEPKSQW